MNHVGFMHQEELNSFLMSRIKAYYESGICQEIWPIAGTIIDQEHGSEESRFVAAQLAAFCRSCDQNGQYPDFKLMAYIAIHACIRKMMNTQDSLLGRFETAAIRCSWYYQSDLSLDRMPAEVIRYLESLS